MMFSNFVWLLHVFFFNVQPFFHLKLPTETRLLLFPPHISSCMPFFTAACDWNTPDFITAFPLPFTLLLQASFVISVITLKQ